MNCNRCHSFIQEFGFRVIIHCLEVHASLFSGFFRFIQARISRLALPDALHNRCIGCHQITKSNKNLPVEGGVISIVFREQNRRGASVHSPKSSIAAAMPSSSSPRISTKPAFRNALSGSGLASLGQAGQRITSRIEAPNSHPAALNFSR